MAFKTPTSNTSVRSLQRDDPPGLLVTLTTEVDCLMPLHWSNHWDCGQAGYWRIDCPCFPCNVGQALTCFTHRNLQGMAAECPCYAVWQWESQCCPVWSLKTEATPSIEITKIAEEEVRVTAQVAVKSLSLYWYRGHLLIHSVQIYPQIWWCLWLTIALSV